MKRFLPVVSCFGALFFANAVAWSQPPQLPEPLYTQNFETEMVSWLALGTGSKVATERVPENVKQGASSLRFDYNVAPGQITPLISALAPRSLDTLQTISFWIKANRNASLIFAIQEQGGGRFGALFSVNADQWQRVEIAADDLVLQVGKGDPKDENGQLDTEKIEGAALLDFDQILAQLGTDQNNPLVALLGIQTGARTIYLDDLVFSSKPLSPEPKDRAIIDDFKHPQAAWLRVGEMTLKTVHDEEAKTHTLQADYQQTPTRIAALAKPLSFGALAKRKELSFDIASKKRVTVIVQVEEYSGGKYNAFLDIPADTTPSVQTLSFDEFKAADDSRDDNNRLDLEQVKQQLIIDASALLGAGQGENTLWIRQIRVE